MYRSTIQIFACWYAIVVDCQHYNDFASASNLRGSHVQKSEFTAAPEPDPTQSATNREVASGMMQKFGEHPGLKEIRLRLSRAAHIFLSAVEGMERTFLHNGSNATGNLDALGLVRLATDMELTTTQNGKQFLSVLTTFADQGKASSQDLLRLAANLQSNMQLNDLPSFLTHASGLIGLPPLMPHNNTSIKELVASMSQVLTQYIIKRGNTSANVPNPMSCEDSVSDSLKAAVDFQLQRQYTGADCTLTDSAFDCADDVGQLLSKYAKEADAVAKAAFECGAVRDTCVQLIADSQRKLMKATVSVMTAEGNCMSDTDQFFSAWCETDVCDALDQLNNFAEFLQGLRMDCVDNETARADLEEALLDVAPNYGTNVSMSCR